MVAGYVAKLWSAWAYAVKNSAIVVVWLKQYLLFAALSLLLAMVYPWIISPQQAVSPAVVPMKIYQQVLSSLDGRDCPSWPVCSVYADQALARHGFVVGSWLLLDRLLHEHDDLRNPRWVLINDEKYLYDPLRRNDFWLED